MRKYQFAHFLKFRTFSATILLAALINISGCGFHLQSSYLIPHEFSTLHLTSQDQYSELTRLVRERLRLNSVTLTDKTNVAELNLLNDSLSRATLSFYPTGNVAEYELIYQVNYTVTPPDGDPKEYKAEIRRDYLDDPRTALAKSREMELLTKEMRIQAADKIVQTLASIDVSN